MYSSPNMLENIFNERGHVVHKVWHGTYCTRPVIRRRFSAGFYPHGWRSRIWTRVRVSHGYPTASAVGVGVEVDWVWHELQTLYLLATCTIFITTVSCSIMTCPGVVGGPQSGGRAMAGLVMVVTLQPSHRPSIPGFCNVLLKYLASTPIK